MTFLSPLLLWFLAAASVPVIIHLLNKRRHKTVQWAAMQFLLKATKESRGKKKLRHILILTCRALGIAALAFAAARPVVSGLIGWGAGSVDTVVLILDRSASMELQSSEGQASKREIVLQKVRDTIDDLGSPRLILIDSASGKPQEIPSPDVLSEISATSATDSAADFPSLLTKAIEYLSTSNGRSEIWLASDLQSSNWHPEDERWAAVRASIASLQQPPAIRVLALSENSVPNTSFRLLGTQRTADGLVLDLEATRGEAERGKTQLPLSVNVNGAGSSESITLPGQSLRFQKRIKISDENENGYGWLSIPADGNPRDNSVFFAYGPARPVKSLLVSPSGEAAEYLELAAAPPGFEKQTAERVAPGNFKTANTSDLALIIWAAPLPTGTNATILENFVNSGGQLVFLPDETESKSDFLGMEWEPLELAEKGKFFILQDWNQTDGPLRDGLDGTSIPAERLRAIKRAIPSGDATSLSRWEDGEPFLTRKVVDQGIVWFLGSTPDYTWSNLGDADVLLPAIQRILTLGTDRFDASFLTEVGSDSVKSTTGIPLIREDNYSGETSPYSAGVFRIGDRLTAVNRSAAEDNLEIAGKENLDAMLEGTDYRLLDQVGQTAGTSESADFWRIFLLAMLFFLISEAILCLPKKATESTMSPRSFGSPAK
ncbi:BatA domain-containing protein [Luteolibacter sp. AS25]|uniref:BatA domain-containing protein n=1 Tax=Luteolibacter sp. AS25 TaxID=3135776 RepID=UPI00398B547F